MHNKIGSPSRNEIWKMFDQISLTYDRVNRVMTLGLDRYWRKKLCSYLPKGQNLSLLDCATGTGDQIIALLQSSADIHSVIGLDLAEAMMEIGRKKIEKFSFKDKVSFQVGSALELPFPQNHFDCVSISFGIRNVTDVSLALRECHRVLKPRGRLLILEGTLPESRWLKSLHLFYLRHLLPRIGGILSKNKNAYRYLNETIETFPEGKAFCQLLEKAHFTAIRPNRLMGGITTIYQADKRE